MPESSKHLVLVGGGHTHSLVLLGLSKDPIPGLRITLVSDVEKAPYSGMLPGHVAGFYSEKEMHIDLRALCERVGAEFLLAEVNGLDPGTRVILTKDQGELNLKPDILSINVGSSPDRSGVPGAAEFAIPSKPVPNLLAGWKRVQDATSGNVVIVGGGAGGIELALAMRPQLPDSMQMTLVHSGDSLVPWNSPKVGREAAKCLTHAGVKILLNERVVEVRSDSVGLKERGSYPADFVFWVTRPSAPDWLKNSGLSLSQGRFIRVKSTLQSIDYPWIFAAGDVASIESEDLPKSGVYAVRMAKPLELNLRAVLSGGELQSYEPQKKVLAIIGTADGKAIATKGRFAIRSRLMWWWKDWIDRKFMRQFVE